MNKEVFSLFDLISKGNSIELDKKQCFQLKIISIYELFEEKKKDKFEKKV